MNPSSLAPSPERARWCQGQLLTFLAQAAETDGQLAIIDALAGQGGDPPAHTHTREDEAQYILEGRVTFFVGGEEIHARAGSFVLLPRGLEHRVRIDSETARSLVVFWPAGYEACLLELSEPAASPTLPPSSTIDHTRLAAASARFGVAYSRTKDGARPAAAPDGRRAYIRQPVAGESLWFLGTLLTILCGEAESAGGLTMVDALTTVGLDAPPRIFNRCDQGVYVVEGTMTVGVDDQLFEAGPGELMLAPRGSRVWMRPGSDRTHGVMFFVPGGIEGFYRDLSEPAAWLEPRPNTANPASLPKLIAAGRKYGVEFTDFTRPSGPGRATAP